MATAVPRTTADLQAWIVASPPFSHIEHAAAVFPDVNDFTTQELEDIMMFAIMRCKTVHALLAVALEKTRAMQANETLINAMEIMNASSPSPVARLGLNIDVGLTDRISEMVFAAKFADGLTFRNCLIAMAVTIKRLRQEITKVEDLLMRSFAQHSDTEIGDEDDWFTKTKEEIEDDDWDLQTSPIEQQKLFEAIEMHFKGLTEML